MKTHTPGPWHVSPQANNQLFICTLSECLAEVFTDEANARLISAAPDMLEALELVVAWEEDYRTRNHLGKKSPDPFRLAKEAVKKAKGGVMEAGK